MSDLRQGGCLCGAARYEIDVEEHDTGNCHCKMCQKNTGGAFLIVTNVAVDKFHWLSKPGGANQSSETVTRRFCDKCGTPLTWESTEFPHIMNIGTGTLDNPSGLRIRYEIYTRNRMHGVQPVEGARQMLDGYES